VISPPPPPAPAAKGPAPKAAPAGRGDLLSQIRAGAKLNKVDKNEIHDASGPALTAEQSSKARAGGGGLEADLAKSLAQYRKFVKNADEDEEEEDDDFK
jgi:hypothetical protein